MQRRTFTQLALVAVLGSLAATPVLAQSGPATIVVGFAAGGSVDSSARLLAERLQQATGHPWIVDNRTGAAGRLAVGYTQRAKPDGKTFMLVPHGPMTLFPHLFTNLGFDPATDFTPIGRVATVDYVLVAANDVPVSTGQDLVKWATENPNLASFGSPGTGTIPHFIGETVANRLGIKMTNVPYKGSALTVNDVVAGIIPLGFMPLADALPMAKANRLKIVATSGQERSALAPQYPTMKEVGIDFVLDGWYAIYGPAGMGPAQVQALNANLAEALAQPEMTERFAGIGLTAASSTPEALAAIMAQERETWRQIVAETEFKPLD